MKDWVIPLIKDGVPTIYGWVVHHPEKFFLGDFTDIGYGTYIQAECTVIIDKYVQIGSHCSIYSINTIDNTSGVIHIEQGACIGAGSIILPRKDGNPLIIGAYAKIGALSLIKDSVRPHSLHIGVNRNKKE